MKKALLLLAAGVAFCANAENFEAGQAYAYPIGPDFHYFDNNEELAAMNINWPTPMMEDGCAFATAEEEAFGTVAVWFNNPAAQPVTVAAADETFPCVEDAWGNYALKMYAPEWWGFGNFNFALPQTSDLCRLRIVFRCDTEGVNAYENPNPIFFRLTDKDIAGGADGIVTASVTVKSIFDEAGYRTVDLYTTLEANNLYLAMTFMPGGFGCGSGKPTAYIQECSIVPVKYLAGNTHVQGDTEVVVSEEKPDFTTVEPGLASIKEINAAAKANNAIYDLQGRRVSNATSGLYIVNGKKTLVK